MEDLITTKKNIDNRIAAHRKKMLENGYSEEDLQILNNALECMIYPIISDHFKHYYEDEQQ
jgi:hypothetical protein